jgi:hypothetical protein
MGNGVGWVWPQCVQVLRPDWSASPGMVTCLFHFEELGAYAEEEEIEE